MHFHRYGPWHSGDITFNDLKLESTGKDQATVAIRFCRKCDRWQSEMVAFRGDVIERFKYLRDRMDMINGCSIYTQERVVQGLSQPHTKA